MQALNFEFSTNASNLLWNDQRTYPNLVDVGRGAIIQFLAVKWGFQPQNHNKQTCNMCPNNNHAKAKTRPGPSLFCHEKIASSAASLERLAGKNRKMRRFSRQTLQFLRCSNPFNFRSDYLLHRRQATNLGANSVLPWF